MREPQVGEFVWIFPTNKGGVAVEVEDIEGNQIYGKIDFSHCENFEIGKRIHFPVEDVKNVENARIYRFNRRCTAVVSEPDNFSTKIALIRELPSPADIELPEVLTSQVDIVAFRAHQWGVSVIGEKDGKFGLFEVTDEGVGQIRAGKANNNQLYWAFFTNQNLMRLALRWDKKKRDLGIMPFDEFEVDPNQMTDPWEYDHYCLKCNTSHEKPCGTVA